MDPYERLLDEILDLVRQDQLAYLDAEVFRAVVDRHLGSLLHPPPDPARHAFAPGYSSSVTAVSMVTGTFTSLVSGRGEDPFAFARPASSPLASALRGFLAGDHRAGVAVLDELERAGRQTDLAFFREAVIDRVVGRTGADRWLYAKVARHFAFDLYDPDSLFAGLTPERP